MAWHLTYRECGSGVSWSRAARGAPAKTAERSSSHRATRRTYSHNAQGMRHSRSGQVSSARTLAAAAIASLVISTPYLSLLLCWLLLSAALAPPTEMGAGTGAGSDVGAGEEEESGPEEAGATDTATAALSSPLTVTEIEPTVSAAGSDAEAEAEAGAAAAEVLSLPLSRERLWLSLISDAAPPVALAVPGAVLSAPPPPLPPATLTLAESPALSRREVSAWGSVMWTCKRVQKVNVKTNPESQDATSTPSRINWVVTVFFELPWEIEVRRVTFGVYVTEGPSSLEHSSVLNFVVVQFWFVVSEQLPFACLRPPLVEQY
jgi:hypothetical protein